MGRRPREHSAVRRLVEALPRTQPARALIVLALYLLLAALALFVLRALFGLLGLLFWGLFAAALTLPAAMLMSSPDRRRPDGDDERPVLLR